MTGQSTKTIPRLLIFVFIIVQCVYFFIVHITVLKTTSNRQSIDMPTVFSWQLKGKSISKRMEHSVEASDVKDFEFPSRREIMSPNIFLTNLYQIPKRPPKSYLNYTAVFKERDYLKKLISWPSTAQSYEYLNPLLLEGYDIVANAIKNVQFIPLVSNSKTTETKSSEADYTINDTQPNDDLYSQVDKMVLELQRMMIPSTTCKRGVKMGGRYCNKLSDGEKFLCLDEEKMLIPMECLVYSFGIGHDFSFEKAMGIFGCEVFSFDDDELHMNYPELPFYRVHFATIRLSRSKDVDARQEIILWNGTETSHMFIYRPLDNIMYMLNHDNDTLSYLKIDIEGSEWEAFNNSLLKTDILNKTRLLSVEVHLENLLNSSLTVRVETLHTVVLKYLSLFTELERFGFQLLYFEPNFVKPIYVSVLGHLVPIYAELHWFNPNAPRGSRLRPDRPVEYYISELKIV